MSTRSEGRLVKSSPHSEPVEGSPPEAEAAPRRGWQPWRKTMFAGALVLLANALAEAILTPDQPYALKLIAQFVGFACLAIGFAMKMRTR